jgi:hypothetical protein
MLELKSNPKVPRLCRIAAGTRQFCFARDDRPTISFYFPKITVLAKWELMAI